VKNDSPAIYIHDTEEEERQSGSSTAWSSF
jgi:hypothetical protein